MNADPLAQLLADAWMDANCLPEVRDVMRPLIEQQATLWAASLRAHRDELLRALGGICVYQDEQYGLVTEEDDVPLPEEVLWVFGDDA